MILLSALLLSIGSPSLPEPAVPSTVSLNENIPPFLHALFDSTLYFGAGTFLGSAALLAGVGWGISQLSPWASTLGNECLLLSKILGIGALHSFAQMFKKSPPFSLFLHTSPSSYSAWNLNKKLLSQIPAFSHEDQELLRFLQKRWLAKCTGCYPFLIDWMCPSFGISLQIHPESTNSYARLISDKYSDTYKNRVEAWKRCLPHPHLFPLILTRPSNICDYFPLCLEILPNESIDTSVARLASLMHTAHSQVVIDLTSVLSNETLDRKQWLAAWQPYENQFSQCCQEHQLDLGQILCIQRVEQEDIGGIRLLPFLSSSKESIDKGYFFLLEWVSRFGLCANRIELDRSLLSADVESSSSLPAPIACESRQEWVSFFNSIDQSWKSTHPQKNLMVKGTVQVLKDLCSLLSQEKWEAVKRSPTRSSAAEVCFTKIKQQLQLLLQEDKSLSFYDTASHLEQVHADLTSLLEIFNPFTAADFLTAFKHHLTSIPEELQPLTGYGIHASGMTSLAGIFKAIEKTLGRAPRVLYGENIYFECVYAVERVSKALPIEKATERDWKEVDLILAQFNPALKRIDFEVTEYHVEPIADVIHTALNAREGKPLSIALDGTLDFSNSQRVSRLLTEFQKEIERGELNILYYRSGLKFDLFGMDNYCGAPFFMIHNRDAKWAFFDDLLTDPVLQTDRLSLNWFALAYQHAAPYLELYRKQVFENTRAVLNRVPERLLSNQNLNYRVIPIGPEADPAFIDIKVFGPFHEFRGGMFVGMFLTIKCMQGGHPLFYRPSLGFYHPNLAVLFGKECTTIRLTLGLDPAQVDIIADCMKKIDALNGPLAKNF